MSPFFSVIFNAAHVPSTWSWLKTPPCCLFPCNPPAARRSRHPAAVAHVVLAHQLRNLSSRQKAGFASRWRVVGLTAVIPAA